MVFLGSGLSRRRSFRRGLFRRRAILILNEDLTLNFINFWLLQEIWWV
jgi:hypothetical protein